MSAISSALEKSMVSPDPNLVLLAFDLFIRFLRFNTFTLDQPQSLLRFWDHSPGLNPNPTTSFVILGKLPHLLCFRFLIGKVKIIIILNS